MCRVFIVAWKLEGKPKLLLTPRHVHTKVRYMTEIRFHSKTMWGRSKRSVMGFLFSFGSSFAGLLVCLHFHKREELFCGHKNIKLTLILFVECSVMEYMGKYLLCTSTISKKA